MLHKITALRRSDFFMPGKEFTIAVFTFRQGYDTMDKISPFTELILFEFR